MSSDYDFVERPQIIRGSGIRDRLIETAGNGKAILVSRDVPGSNTTHLRRRGYQVRMTKRGAPEGMVFAWCEKIVDPKASEA